MRHLARLRRAHAPLQDSEDDPLSGIANLFDLSVAFIVALLIALFSMGTMRGLLDPSSRFTMVKQNADGTMEIITKDQQQIKVQKVTDRELSGQGTRLGMAYRLPDGQVVYVPDSTAK
jgi:hypothetical protein